MYLPSFTVSGQNTGKTLVMEEGAQFASPPIMRGDPRPTQVAPLPDGASAWIDVLHWGPGDSFVAVIGFTNRREVLPVPRPGKPMLVP